MRQVAIVLCCTVFFVLFVQENTKISFSFSDQKDKLSSQIDVTTAPQFGKTHFIVGQTAQQRADYEEQRKNSVANRGRAHGDGLNVHREGPKDIYSSVFFSPDDDTRTCLLDFINQEKRCIHIAVFIFTDKHIANALVNAYNRGVAVEVVTDPTCVKDRHNKIGLLCDAGIPVFVYNAQHTTEGYSSIMHHKFIVFCNTKDNHPLLWTGSLNLTKSACDNNQENVVISNDITMIEKFEKQFELLKSRSYKYVK